MATHYGKDNFPETLVPSVLCREDFDEVYSLLDVHPLNFDCGILCGSLCCQEYEPGVGMYLLPGEQQMFTGKEAWLNWRFVKAKDHDFPPDWKGEVPFVTCNATCPRDKRPIQCRTFPLMPYLTPGGELLVKLDTLSGILLCPVVKEPDKYPLRPEFYAAALSAWRILIKDPLIRSDVWQLSREVDQDDTAVWRNLLKR